MNAVVVILIVVVVGVGVYFATQNKPTNLTGSTSQNGNVRPSFTPNQKCTMLNGASCQTICNGLNGNPPAYTCNQTCNTNTPVCGDTPYNPVTVPTYSLNYAPNKPSQSCFNYCDLPNEACQTLQAWQNELGYQDFKTVPMC